MVHRLSIVILSIYGLLGTTGMVSGADYYCDSKAGDDGHDGLSALTAWKTLIKAKSVKFKAGDRILLKRGSVFSGKIELKDVAGELYDHIIDPQENENVADKPENAKLLNELAVQLQANRPHKQPVAGTAGRSERGSAESNP